LSAPTGIAGTQNRVSTQTSQQYYSRGQNIGAGVFQEPQQTVSLLPRIAPAGRRWTFPATAHDSQVPASDRPYRRAGTYLMLSLLFFCLYGSLSIRRQEAKEESCRPIYILFIPRHYHLVVSRLATQTSSLGAQSQVIPVMPELVVLSPLRTMRPLLGARLTVVSTIGSVRVVVAARLVHEAIPRTITVHRISHCLIRGVLFATGLTSFQNVSSLASSRPLCVASPPVPYARGRQEDFLHFNVQSEDGSIIGCTDAVNCFQLSALPKKTSVEFSMI